MNTQTTTKINGTKPNNAPIKATVRRAKAKSIDGAIVSVEAAPRPSLLTRFMLSEQGKKLSKPISQSEKEMAVSGTLTGVACAVAGPVVGALAAVAATAADSNSTKSNWAGVGAVGAGSIAAVGAGLSAVAGAAAATASTGLAMLLNRLR